MHDIVIDINKSKTLIYVKDKDVYEFDNIMDNKNPIIEKDYHLLYSMLKKNIKETYNHIIKKKILILYSISTDLNKKKLVKLFRKLGFFKIDIFEKEIYFLQATGIDISKPSVTLVINTNDANIDLNILALNQIIIKKTLDNDYEELKQFLNSLRKEIVSDINNKGIMLIGTENDKEGIKKALKVPVFLISKSLEEINLINN